MVDRTSHGRPAIIGRSRVSPRGCDLGNRCGAPRDAHPLALITFGLIAEPIFTHYTHIISLRFVLWSYNSCSDQCTFVRTAQRQSSYVVLQAIGMDRRVLARRTFRHPAQPAI